MRIRALLVVTALALPPRAAAQVAELLPVDEAVRAPDFFTFRAQLQAAVARRDTAALLAVVHPDVRNTFGDDNGIAAFRRRWGLAEGGDDLWRELGLVLALGGSFSDDSTFTAPYVFSAWPDTLDAFEHVAVIGRGVRVRAAPDAASAVIGVLSFAVVPRVYDPKRGTEPASSRWVAVRLGDGRTGFVAAGYVRSPVDYRAIFRRRGGQWQLLTFIAGD